MLNEPTRGQLDKIPSLYKPENIALKDKLIYLHFFIADFDWYIMDFDGDDIFWGFAIFGADRLRIKWGYIYFSELKEINIQGLEVDCDLFWNVRPAREVDKILKCHPFWQ